MVRSQGAVIVACMLACALPALAQPSAPHPKPMATPEKLPAVDSSISIFVNGDELARDPAPRIVGKGGGTLVVPVVKIFAALGIAVRRDGDSVIASAADKQIVLHIGSAQALIDNRPVTMEAPAMTIDGATYVPLRFVADSLGAQATFNRHADRVEIVSSLVGRNPGLEQRGADGMSQVVGSVSAVDLNSQPPSITVERGTDVRTVAITSDARVELQDVIARTSTPATLADVHVGDAVSALILRDGHVDSVVVRYASRNGTIAAVSPTQFVLNTGFLLSPDKTTTITLNAQPATLSDLKVGDSVVVRLNPDTNEKRQIIVSRPMPPVPGPPGAVQITAFTVDAKSTLRGGDTIDVRLNGTPGGRATYDLGTYLTGLALTENSPGVYAAHFTVPSTINVGRTAIYGHLTVNGTDATRAEAGSEIAVSNTPPQIIDIAPSNNQTVNNNQPSIYATFRTPTDVGVNPASVTITINGLDVTPSATRTDQFITYRPGSALGDGPVSVIVRISDLAGNEQTRAWSFVIHSH
jgi:hypothetical protein